VLNICDRTIVYKGQLTPEQVQFYFKQDLNDERFTSYMALVKILVKPQLASDSLPMTFPIFTLLVLQTLIYATLELIAGSLSVFNKYISKLG
jgi:hypothetical protein